MFGFMVALATFFNNMRLKWKVQSNEAKERQDEIKAKVFQSKGVRDQKLKEMDKTAIVDKSVTYMLYFLSLLVAFFETIIVVISVFKFILIFFIIVVVLVLVFAFIAVLQALISDEADFLANLDKEDVSKIENSCSRQISGQVQWTKQELETHGATLTTYQKNFYKLGILTRQGIDGELVERTMLSDMKGDASFKIPMAVGILSTEGLEGDLSTADFFKEPTNTPVTHSSTGKSYGFLGVGTHEKLSASFSQSGVTKIKASYSPNRTPSHDADFAPWGVALSLNELEGKYKYAMSNEKTQKAIEKAIQTWGIEANKDEFVTYTEFFMTQLAYHGFYFTDMETYAGWFGALFAISSDDDAKRSFRNYTLNYTGTKSPSYDESSIRNLYIGDQTYAQVRNKSAISSFPGIKSSTPLRIQLNGTDINEPLWVFVSKNADSSKFSSVESGVFNVIRNVPVYILNFHYGFNSMLQGFRLETDLAKAMSVGGVAETTIICDQTGYGEAPVNVTIGDYKVTPGRTQSTYKGMPLEQYIDSKLPSVSSSVRNLVGNLREHWGTSAYLTDPTSQARVLNYEDKIRGVPYFAQGTRGKESFIQEIYTTKYSHKFWETACMIYSYAHTATALTGVLVNPAEMASLVEVEGAMTVSGISTTKMPSIFSGFGLSSKIVETLKQAELDSVLDKGGVAIIRTTGVGPNYKLFTVSSYSRHFQVITGKEIVGDETRYHMYNSSGPNEMSTNLFKLSLIDSHLNKSASSTITYVWKE